jgi:hypothetical protein
MPLPLIYLVGMGVTGLAGLGVGGVVVANEIVAHNAQVKRNKYSYSIAEIFGFPENTSLSPFLIKQGSQIDENGDSQTSVNYIRWDALAHLFNAVWIPDNPKDGGPLFTIQTVQEVNADRKIDGTTNGRHLSPLLYARIVSPLTKKMRTEAPATGLLDMSVDSTVCLLPHQIRREDTTTMWPRLGRLWPPFVLEGIAPKRGNDNIRDEFASLIEIPLTPEVEDSYIGGIYLCVERLEMIYKKMSEDQDGNENKDFNLFDFIKEIWKEVNGACADSHEFTLHVDHERPNVVKIIDLAFKKEETLTIDDMVKVEIQSTKSVARDFQYSTSIPSSMTATIAIAAQAPDAVENLEQASFAALHKNISNRLAQKPERPREVVHPDEAEREDLAGRFEAYKKNYIEGITALDTWSYKILGGEFTEINEEGQAEKSDEISKHKGILRTVQEAMDKLTKLYPVDNPSEGIFKGMPNKTEAIAPRSAVIPLKFTATLDGISGIVIGNVFRVPSNRLPRGYKDANIAFVCMGEEQKITAGQDWTTKITGQMILIDDPNAHQNGGDDGWDYNEFDEEAGEGKFENSTDYNADRDEDNITDEQNQLDPKMNDVFEGDWVYLKTNTETNVRDKSCVEDGVDNAGFVDNIEGKIPAGNKGLKLGKVKGVLSQTLTDEDDIKNLGIKQLDDGTFVNKNGEPLLNKNVPWYRIKFTDEAAKIINDNWEMFTTETDEWEDDQIGYMRIDVLQHSADWYHGKEEDDQRRENIDRIQHVEKYYLNYVPGKLYGANLNPDGPITKAYMERWDLTINWLIGDQFYEDNNINAREQYLFGLGAMNKVDSWELAKK